ncbi:FAD-dependent oxidoreductase [Microbacterium caowuchunii]|uniref:FAD-dependent oxidoreductase n=1 Tax=Microbacterium caowuchunii TaxID=2614638 RepID=A0A5N0TMR4_9MICO|nr:FAD-dependent oxidoreductase [Microbacterium caowuchunii]KAA9135467.1 FAD-dependent oxidoreductase [Microbacterium caowuchunii]
MRALWKTDRPAVEGTEFASGAHDVVIVGAGLTGLATALMLVQDGFDVAVLEAGEVANLTSGANTGKMSLLQGTRLSHLRAHHPASLVRAYVDANRDGMEWLRGFADAAGVTRSSRTAYTYAQTTAGRESIDRELAAAREAGLPVRRGHPDELAGLPFPVTAAVALDGQVAIDPDAVTTALAQAFVDAGGTLHTNVRVTGVSAFPRARVRTDQGEMGAGRIVLATGMPIADRGLYWAKVSGSRSLCIAFDVPGAVPDGLLLSADSPSRSLRSVTALDGPVGAGNRLIVGGNGYPVGRTDSEAAGFADLVAWTERFFPGSVETCRWAAQDYESHNGVPFVGAMPRGFGRIRLATGYAKWGLTNAPAAALRLAAEIRGDKPKSRPRWMTQLGTRLTMPGDIARGLGENAKVGGAAVAGWLSAERTAVPVPRPAEGEGVVAQRNGKPVGISTVEGETRAVSAVCPHLGGVLSWNDAECTWDCPLHASRFQADGTRIEGPALSDLERLPRARGRHPQGDDGAASAGSVPAGAGPQR